MSGVIVCALWHENDKRFRSRHYHSWDRACTSCERKVVVGDADKSQIDANGKLKILCEQCALIYCPEEAIEEDRAPSEDACPACEELKRQHEAAQLEAALCRGLPDGDADRAAQKRLEHLSRARWAHRFKAHMDERRGR
jgi:hypothetical protein